MWLLPFALLFAPMLLAAFIAVVCGLFVFIDRSVSPPFSWLIFASLWTFGEWGRGVIFPHFPWNPLGSIWAFDERFIQAAAFVGVWGLSLLTAAIAALFVVAYRRRSRATALAAAAVLLALPAAGTWRLATQPTQFTDVKLYIIQPAIPQEERWRFPFKNIRIRLELSRQALADDPPEGRMFLLWAESSSPLQLGRGQPITEMVSALLTEKGAAAVGNISNYRGDYYNSLTFITPNGEIADIYHKTILVPFGEYLPARPLLEAIGLKKTIGGGDFSSGSGPKVVRLPEFPPFIPLICFESIFPDFAASAKGGRWFFNATNDGWFGVTPGPYQHLAAARMRAVENGLPLARAAAGGISAVIDGNGRLIAELPLGERGALIERLPRSETTIFHHFGLFITFFLVFLWLLITILWIVIGRRGLKINPTKPNLRWELTSKRTLLPIARGAHRRRISK